jgi:glycosyltransferase involved in cell wall biosynthesis
VKKDIEKYYGIPDSKIALTYNGCQPEFVPITLTEQEHVKSKYSAGKDYFLFVGAVHPRKNVHRLIAAFDEFKKQTNADVKLLIAGRFAWQTGEVKSAFDASSFQNDIHFLGFVPVDELPRLMAAAFALTYVSLSEGFGIPLLEAMFCEVPIITSNVSSMPEIAGEAAILVDPANVSEIADAMVAVYSSPALRQNLIEKGRKARTRFNWDSSAAKVYELLLQIAKS